MRRVLMFIGVMSLGCVLGLSPVGLAQTATPAFTPIDPLGALMISVNGVNSGSGGTCLAPGWTRSPGQHNGQTQGEHVGLCNNPNAVHTGGSQLIVGYYTNAVNTTTSFTLSGTSLNTLSLTGASVTYAFGVNTSGQIVGTYVDSTLLRVHGFVLSGGTVTTLDHPGAARTFATGMNSAGQVVGYSQDATGRHHGFVYSGGSSGTYTDFDSTLEPGILGTFAMGINSSGQIVGYYLTHNFRTRKAFQRTPQGVISQLNIIGADTMPATDAAALGINTSGQIVGTFSDGSALEHGFVYFNGTTTQVDIPGALDTQANGINDATPTPTIVGEYVDPTNLTQYGFHMP